MFFEMTPVFTWGMFSTNIDAAPEKNYVFYDLKYNGKTFNLPTAQDHWKIFFSYTIPNYDNIKANGYEDPLNSKYAAVLQKLHIDPAFASHISNKRNDVQRYPQWLKRYMENNTGEQITHLEVTKRWVKFDAGGILQVDSSKIIINE
ncbi:hypothetical protein DBR32_05380 [Taibaiella sp. KBW10]|nr:hypothetical protein DBR32_05380 [Taibaiella sp. KBW10]